MHLLRLAMFVTTATVVVACAQVSLAPAPVTVARPVPTRSHGASAPVAGTTVSVAASSPRTLAKPSTMAPLPVPAAVSPAVAAHFPAPSVTFATPAFAPGRTEFTRNDEVADLLQRAVVDAAASRRATQARVIEIGSSQGGEPIVAIEFSRPPPLLASRATSDPAALAPSARRPTVVLIAGQHGDEPAPTEALLVLTAALAQGRHDAVLDRVDVVLVPLVNPDGRALFQREAADGTDVNRDHLLLRSPEAQAVARLMAAVEPVVVADFHEYPVDGAFADRFAALPRFDVLLQAATTGNMAPFVSRAAEEWFRRPLARKLDAAGFATGWYHRVSDTAGDLRVAMGGAGTGLARNAFGLRNAVSLLIETRGGGLGRVDLKRRVMAALTASVDILESAGSRAADLVKLHDFVDRDVAGSACRGNIVVEAAPTSSEYALAMIDPVSGEIRSRTVSWDSALVLRTLRSRPRPCGYWLAASQGEAVSRLRLLGVEVQQFDEAADLRGETYRETGRSDRAAAGSSGKVEGQGGLRVRTQPTLLDAPAGSYFVSLEQPLANLVVAALEPDAPGSYAAAGIVTTVGDESRVLDRPQARMTTSP